ncbi:hypothetical protein KIN20_024153 [Parelaphostrongylus tenuis]|uniref:Uncharacterized protein n=1 Tax=Parelaphostrongylus tenuis TaxID=148309 RepID=A0AAD5MWM8_PARTN|nr:hypothetical protein KIN20_024153 [Parelaphostrongylus tenuis]
MVAHVSQTEDGAALLSNLCDGTKAEQKEKEKKGRIEEARRPTQRDGSFPSGWPSMTGRRGDAPRGAQARCVRCSSKASKLLATIRRHIWSSRHVSALNRASLQYTQIINYEVGATVWDYHRLIHES